MARSTAKPIPLSYGDRVPSYSGARLPWLHRHVVPSPEKRFHRREITGLLFLKKTVERVDITRKSTIFFLGIGILHIRVLACLGFIAMSYRVRRSGFIAASQPIPFFASGIFPKYT